MTVTCAKGLIEISDFEVACMEKAAHMGDIDKISEDDARSIFEIIRWPEHITCTHCKCEDTYKLNGVSHRKGLHQCNACRKQFTVTVGTVMDSTRLSMKQWLKAFKSIYTSKVSALQLQSNLSIGSYRTAWKLHRTVKGVANNKSYKYKTIRIPYINYGISIDNKKNIELLSNGYFDNKIRHGIFISMKIRKYDFIDDLEQEVKIRLLDTFLKSRKNYTDSADLVKLIYTTARVTVIDFMKKWYKHNEYNYNVVSFEQNSKDGYFDTTDLISYEFDRDSALKII